VSAVCHQHGHIIRQRSVNSRKVNQSIEHSRALDAPRRVKPEGVADAREVILKVLAANGGSLPLHDKSDPAAIQKTLGTLNYKRYN